MSYVLDALKKSEQERRTLQRPSTLVSPVPDNTSKPRYFGWLLVIIPVLFILAWLLMQWQESKSSLNIKVQIPSDSGDVLISVEEPLISPDDIQHQSLPVSTSKGQKVLIHSSSTPSEKKPVIHVEEKRPVFRTVTPASPIDGINTVLSINNVEDLTVSGNTKVQLLHELPIAVQQSIPDIKIEGHIYDVEPHARMVIINGKVRREKQSIGSAMTLQEITPDGVIINDGRRAFHIGVFD